MANQTISPQIDFYLAGKIQTNNGSEDNTSSYTKIPYTPYFSTYAEAETFYGKISDPESSNLEFYQIGNDFTFDPTKIVIIQRIQLIPHKPKIVGESDSYKYAPLPEYMSSLETYLASSNKVEYNDIDEDQGILKL